MTKSSVITARIDPDLKHDTETILRQLGLTPSQAITLFYRQVTLLEGLPFQVSLPNATTKRALREAQARYPLESYDSVDGLFEDLEE